MLVSLEVRMLNSYKILHIKCAHYNDNVKNEIHHGIERGFDKLNPNTTRHCEMCVLFIIMIVMNFVYILKG